ncbi:hypothetical protein [Thomasclavelia sp.]|uniref:hypothetical protein n=1 Tax=Thomasclavelia sp. TaxID=3025757 RepID=UPI0025E501FE|nr:hypothetical protein [Thomasclavelia sp.]
MFFYLYQYLMIGIITVLADIIYYAIYKKDNYNHKIDIRLLYFLQAILLIGYVYFKDSNGFVSVCTYNIANLLPIFAYQDTLKNKLCYYLIVVTLFILSELFISFTYVLVVSLLGYNVFFIDDIIGNNASTYYLFVFVLMLSDILLTYIICKLFNKINVAKLSSELLLMNVVILLMINTMNLIYVATKKNFMIMSIIYLFCTIVIIALVYKSVSNLIRKHEENILDKKRLYILNMQMQELKHIDDHYKKIRKRNHDWMNHYLVLSQLFENNDEKIINYVDELIKKYDSGVK